MSFCMLWGRILWTEASSSSSTAATAATSTSSAVGVTGSNVVRGLGPAAYACGAAAIASQVEAVPYAVVGGGYRRTGLGCVG